MWRILFYGEETDARDVANQWSDALIPEALAVSLFENEEAEQWLADALYDTKQEASAALELLDEEHQLCASIAPVPEKDWVAVSLEGLEPVRAGCFVIHGHHHENVAGPDEIPIVIDAGQAFGTGHHGTTLGCLMAIDRLGERKAFRNTLDLGCGTGVLAMAVAKRLAAPVVASDNDPVAIEVAEANAAENGCGQMIRFVTAEGLDHGMIAGTQPFDLIVANILLEPLMALAEPITRALAPDGILIVSGILTEQEEPLLAAYKPQGLRLADRLRIDEWSTLVLTR